jgi:hypothetical protein
MSIRRRALVASVAVLIMISGCGVAPVEPTAVVLPTHTIPPLPTDGPQVTLTAMPLPSLPSTWTPAPPTAGPPTVTLLPSYTPPPATATRDQAAELPLVVTNEFGATVLKLTEPQINAALARRFDAAPLPDFAAAPRVKLGDGAMAVTMRIVPYQAPPGSSPQAMTLTVSLAIYAGALEVHPTQLAPLEVGVLTRQVKPGQALLLQTLNDLVSQAAGKPRTMTYNYVDVRPDGVSLTVVAGQ